MTRRRLRRDLQLLKLWAGASSLALLVLAVAAFGQNAPRNLGEVTVERINVVDADGRLRLVISDKDRFPDPVVNGKTAHRQGEHEAGLIFYNDEGDENGGLAYDGRAGAASGALMFDQYKQDQTVGIEYEQQQGRRSAGLHVWDRPDEPLDVLIDGLAAARSLPTEAERQAAIARVRAAHHGTERVFVGKRPDKSAVVTLADAAGKPRIVLDVTADGTGRLQFLDANGKVVQQLPR